MKQQACAKKKKVFLPHGGKTWFDFMPNYGILTFRKGKESVSFRWVGAPSKTWGYIGHGYVYPGGGCSFPVVHGTASGYGYDKLGSALGKACAKVLEMQGHSWKYGLSLGEDEPQDIVIPRWVLKVLQDMGSDHNIYDEPREYAEKNNLKIGG